MGSWKSAFLGIIEGEETVSGKLRIDVDIRHK